MALRQNIYATLFPHIPQASARPLSDENSSSPRAAIGETDGDASTTGIPEDDRRYSEAPANYDNPVQLMPPGLPAAANAESENAVPNDLNKMLKWTPPEIDAGAFSKPAAKVASPLEEATANYQNALAEKPKKQNPWLQALFLGLQASNKFFNPNDQSEIQWLGDAKKANKVGRAQRELAPLEALEVRRQKAVKERADIAKAEAEAKKTALETTGVGLSNQGKTIGNQKDMSQTLLDTIKADGQVTPAEAAYFKAQSGFDITDYDARKFKTEWVNGQPMTAPELGAPRFTRNPTLDADVLKTPVESTIGDTNFVSTSPQAMTAQVGVAQANAQRAQGQAQFEVRQATDAADKEFNSEKDWRKAEMDWVKETQTAKGKYNGAHRMLKSAQANREELKKNNYDTSEVDKQIGQAEKDMEEAAPLMNLPRPKKFIRPPTPVSNTSKGGKNNNIGDGNSFRNALQKVKSKRR
ncbi:MAG TPA: hypothetical protein VNI84_17275 [Pyrinomonadaceae bacterium]|nr:hypothetical protein [Pyrinomonadaceae bacterium]